jgi:hypothetical protein
MFEYLNVGDSEPGTVPDFINSVGDEEAGTQTDCLNVGD